MMEWQERIWAIQIEEVQKAEESGQRRWDMGLIKVPRNLLLMVDGELTRQRELNAALLAVCQYARTVLEVKISLGDTHSEGERRAWQQLCAAIARAERENP